MGYCKPEVILGIAFSLKMPFLMKIIKGAFMSKQKNIDPQIEGNELENIESSLYNGWKAAKPNYTFYSTTCNSTPHSTPSPFALKIEEKRKKQSAPACDI